MSRSLISVLTSGYASAIRSNIPAITTVRVYSESAQPFNSKAQDTGPVKIRIDVFLSF